MIESSFMNLVVVSSNAGAVTKASDVAAVLSKEILDIQATTECRLTLKRVCDAIRTQLYCFTLKQFQEFLNVPSIADYLSGVQ